MEGRWEQLVVPGPPHPVCGQPRGESEGQALNLGPSPPRAAWTEARNEGDGKAAAASRCSPRPPRPLREEGGGGKMAPPAPGRSRFRHSGRPADGGGGGGASQGAGRSRAEAGPPRPPAPGPALAGSPGIRACEWRKGGCLEVGAGFSMVVPSHRARSGRKMKHSEFHLDMRTNFLWRVTEHWSRLPRDFVGCPSLETFQTHLNAFLRHLLQVILPWVRLDGL